MATTVVAAAVAHPLIAPPGQHVRRPPRQLQTLPERKSEEYASSEETSDHLAPRPSSMVISSSASSASSAETTALRSQTLSYTHPPASRRHTTYLAPPAGPVSVRPLRSSPLAGPALALKHDGTFANLAPSPVARPRSLLSMAESVYNEAVLGSASGSMSALSSRAASRENLPSTAVPDEEQQPPTPPLPSQQTPSKRLSFGLKRLSALPSLPAPHRPVSAPPSENARAGAEIARAKSVDSQVPSIPVWARPSFVHSTTAPTPMRRPSTAPASAFASSSTSAPHRRPSSTYSHRTPTIERIPMPRPHPGSLARLQAQKKDKPNTSRNPELNWLTQAAPPKFSRLGLKAEGVVMPVSARDLEGRKRESVVSTVGSVGVSRRESMVDVGEKGKAKESIGLSRGFGSLRGRAEAVINGFASNMHAQKSQPKHDHDRHAKTEPADATPSPTEIVELPLPLPTPPFMQTTNPSSSSVPSMSSVPEVDDEHEHEENEEAESDASASSSESSVPQTPSLSRASSLTDDHSHEHDHPLPDARVLPLDKNLGHAPGETAMEVRVEIVGEEPPPRVSSPAVPPPPPPPPPPITAKVMNEKKDGHVQATVVPAVKIHVLAERRATLKRAWRRVVGGLGKA